MVELPKSRPPRVHRYAEPTAYHHSEENLGWAVSYADVLMVLLSFFAVFSSLSKSETNSILQKIVEIDGRAAPANKNLKGEKSATISAPVESGSLSQSSIGEAPTRVELSKETLVSKLKTLDPNVRIQTSNNSEVVVLMLPNNSYTSGSLSLRPKARKIFNSTLKEIEKYKSEIDITFVGYSDNRAVRKRKSNTIRTNFDLSALRASRALQRAAKMGFPMERLRARGQGPYGRDSRTLSIQISLKGAAI